MSQSRSADAARRVTLRAQRGAGSVLAPRNWRMAGRLLVLVAIPLVLGLALAGLRVTDATRSAQAYGQVGRLAAVGQQVTGLAQAMEDERAATAAFLADGRPAAGLVALHRQYAITDRWAATVRRQVLQLGPGYPAQTRASAATVLTSIAELPALRWHAAQRQATPLGMISGYSAATAGLFPVNDSIADTSGNSALISSVRALGSLSRLTDQAAQQQAILGAALAAGHFEPGALTALSIAQAQQASDLASFRGSATPEESWALTGTLAGPLARQAQAVEQRATAAGNGALVLGARASQQWQAGMSYTVGWMRRSGQQLATWTTAYARALQRGATRSAMITGGAALAILLLVLLATVIIAGSLARSLRRLERRAGEEARLRRSTSVIFASFFGRSHSLLARLLRLVDGLELGEEDPERLASLFQVDHLATRMRRNSDSALVLAGHDIAGHRTEPVTLVDVLRAAVSEIEQYDRVILNVQQRVSVSGSAAADTAHLLAELLENATKFSPGTTRVTMSERTARGGDLLISISDGGMGIPEEQLTQLNRQLAHPSLTDAAVVRQMGLFTVAHLAVRHGIKVTLEPRPGGGTTAAVRLPVGLISKGAKPGGWPGHAGEFLRAGGRGTVAAADPRRAAPRFTAGPQLTAGPQFTAGPQVTAGPQIAGADAVALTLGAPLPTEAPSASFAGTVPESAGAGPAAAGPAGTGPAGTGPAGTGPAGTGPAGTGPAATGSAGPEPGGVLPIFESLESDYVHAHSHGLLWTGEPPAGEPPAGEPPAGEPSGSEHAASEHAASEHAAGEPQASQPTPTGMPDAAATSPASAGTAARRDGGLPGGW